MSKNFTNGFDLLEKCELCQKSIWEIMIEREMENTDRTRSDILNEMKQNLDVMKNAVQKGLHEDVKSVSGLVGGDAKKLRNRYETKETVSGKRMSKAVANAMAVLEVNASMGQIVATPTAGSSGILPGAIIAVGEDFDVSDEELTKVLFTGAAIGYLITRNATVSGAEGGCQAETGAAAAMASGAIVELLGGTPNQALHAAAMCIKNIMGLVCDPIAGLVEVPCVKRNAIGTANALVSADMALAGIESTIPFDEVVEAMYKVGRSLPCELRETAMGGLAQTPTGIKIQQRIFS